MTEMPYMRFWVKDHIADTLHLTCLEHGAYVLLLLAMWNNGGQLPNDDAYLSRVCRLRGKSWAKARSAVMPFFDVKGDQIIQKRLVKELEDATDAATKNKERASRGGQAKALKYNKAKSLDADTERASGTTNSVLAGCQSESDPYPESDSETPSENPSGFLPPSVEGGSNGETANEPATSRPKNKSEPKGTRLPANWQPSEKDLAFAKREGLDRATALREADKFIYYWTSKAGSGAKKTNWSSTWCNWVMNAAESRKKPDPPKKQWAI